MITSEMTLRPQYITTSMRSKRYFATRDQRSHKNWSGVDRLVDGIDVGPRASKQGEAEISIYPSGI